ncbi:uncharacterized protein LOC132386096 [Hypanus sabinus]|uniref:uncharacterized protein LOC132386096 n=1 Tax=Hypanus sabinus TaxID=79690 RepID=UPI0028C3F576|nr:uncharacterized protein LOC132386096 [Hypanus sabinus]
MLPVYLLIASLVTGADLTESPCLLSDVLCTTADYQLRRYKESVWVGTHVDVSISPKVDTSMQRLLSYTRGGNSEELWIQSNGQFLISFTGDGEITMYLLVPEELWENPPTPTSPQAFITRFPTMDVLSRRIRWNAMTQANDFNRTLTEQNAKFNNSFFFVSFCKGSDGFGSLACPSLCRIEVAAVLPCSGVIKSPGEAIANVNSKKHY